MKKYVIFRVNDRKRETSTLIKDFLLQIVFKLVVLKNRKVEMNTKWYFSWTLGLVEVLKHRRNLTGLDLAGFLTFVF